MSHSYATDAQTESADLATTIVVSSTPEQISNACASVESFLHRHSPDQSRWFFSITFPTLICKIFGFDAQKPQHINGKGWIDILASANGTEIYNKVFNFLSPTGVLMSCVTSVDRLSLVKYVFPIEGLPEWVYLTLQNVRECGVLSDLCPLFKGRLKDLVPFQFHMNILEYYLFWFAYYPGCKGIQNDITIIDTSVPKSSRLENWNYRYYDSKPRLIEHKKSDIGNLYKRLLCAYLGFFVPLGDLNAHSLLHDSSSSHLETAEFFVHTLIHFWIVDNDFSPLSVKLCKSFGVVLPLGSSLAKVAPTPGLGDVVNVFAKYLSSRFVPNGVDEMYWNSCIQRSLYRYILRTFLFSPSVKKVSQVFSVWVNYMEPWAISLDDVDVNMKRDSVTISIPHEYSSSWEGFVLSNYLFYSSLVMHFIGFAHKFIHTDPEVIVQMVSKVVNVLTSSRELVDLIKNVDTVFHSVPPAGSMLNTLYSFVPSIREQLQDWEDGLSESDADENGNKDLKLFSTSENGGQQLLQLLALRAESEDKLSNNLQLVNSIKAQFFGGNITSPTTTLVQGKQSQDHHEIDIRYEGDWMKRPISSDEVAWLANLLLKISVWLNQILGLENGNTHHNVDNVMREHGMRVNLRMLASKKLLTMLLLIALAFTLLKTMFF